MKFSSVLPICLSFAIISQAAPMNFDKRRFGQEHTPEADALFQEVKDLAQGSDKEAQAGNLSGAMVRALLAKAPACDQQDRADEVIDLGKEFGGDKEKQFIDVAKKYRQLERNTPNAGQPSELCKKPPKNKELDGLVQKQDPTGDGKTADPNTGDGKAADPNTGDGKAADPNTGDGKAADPNTGDGKAADPNTGDGKAADPNTGDGKAADPNTCTPNNPDDKGKTADPNNPDDKGKTADPNNPDDKGKTADPNNPDDKGKTADPTDPNNPDDKGKTADPTDPNNPDDKGKTADPTDPNTGDNPAETNPVGGVKMPKIKKQNGDFIVNGNGFNGNLEAAHARQCDVQKNQCFNKFNGGDKSFSGQDCENQVQTCKDGPPVFE